MTVAAERDGRDAEALHVVALEEERVVGTCRVLFREAVARLGRMAVLPGERRRGVGVAVLREAERVARESGARRMALHAQTYARELYEREGYRQRGDTFSEEGIEHVAMEKPL